MKTTKTLSKLLLIVASTLLLFGCHPEQVLQQTNQATATTMSKIDDAQYNSEKTAPAVVTNPGYYVDTTPMSLKQKWLKKHISIQAKKMPFELLMSRILRNTNVPVEYQNNASKSCLISIQYSGTIKGALDELAAKTDYGYTISEQAGVVWSTLVTKTFNVSFLPGSSTYLLGQTSSDNEGGNKSHSNASNINTVTGNLSDQQYSGLKASLSLWADVRNTLKEMVSKDGKFYVSEATTSVTVTDHPSRIKSIQEYIQKLNKEMSKQVRLKIQVLEIVLNQSHAYGIDWNLVQNWLGTQFKIGSGLFSDANNSPGSAGGISPVGLLQIGPNGNNAMLQALNSQGKLRVVTEPTAVTMNDQMVEFRITRDTSYLQSVSSTTSGLSYLSTTSLNPGVVTDGFVLYLLPKINNDRVYLQISSTISSLISLDKISSGSSDITKQEIQVPRLSEKRFNMRSLVPNGKTLVIAGFKQMRDESKQNKMWGSSALGGQASQNQNVETILLITPTVINGDN